MKTEICRTAYCIQCAQAERPKTGGFYAVRGSQGVHVHQIQYAHPRDNPYGFVPHLFILEHAKDGIITATRICLMHECGVDIRNNPDYETDAKAFPYIVYFQEKKKITMKVSDWNALVLTKSFGYRLDD